MDTLADVRGPALVVGLAGTLWTASAAFSSIRRSLNAVWGIYERRPFITSKLVDFAQMGFMGAVVFISFLITGLIAAVREFTVDWFGFLSDSYLWEIPGALVPLFLIAIAMLLLYRYVPVAHPSWREVAIPAGLAALALWILSNGFAFYVANFNNFDAIYGALAGVFLFLLFMNLTANVILIGGELSRTFHRYGLGELDELIHPEGPPESVVQQTIRMVKGMFVRQP